MLETTPDPQWSDDARVERNLAVNRLYARHNEALIGYLRKRLGSEAEAREVAQESYLRICRQSNGARLPDHDRAYLFETANNLVRDRRRQHAVRSKARQLGFDRLTRTNADDVETPLAFLEYKLFVSTVRQTLLDMHPRTRRVFVLRRFEGLSNRQIADRLGVAERTVERRMHRALRRLKRALLKANRKSETADGARR